MCAFYFFVVKNKTHFFKMKRARVEIINGQEQGKFSVDNIIAIGDYGKPIDARLIERNLIPSGTVSRDSKFNDCFQGIAFRKVGAERARGLIFPSGKILVTLTQSKTQLCAATNTMLGLVNKILYPLKNPRSFASFELPKLQNAICSFEIGFEIQLEYMELILKKNPDFKVTYEPEIHGSLFLQLKHTNGVPLTIIVSSQGKVVLSGALGDFIEIKKMIISILEKYKKVSNVINII
jgi:TATA-box binding protein (TBP) (component of TFIID and TFIIIB)